MVGMHLKSSQSCQDSEWQMAEDQALAEALFAELRLKTGGENGINRICYSAAETTALEIIASKAKSFGLDVSRDEAANLVITLVGTQPDLPFIACGSHLDAVPCGGNYDGAAGIVAGLAVLGSLRANHTRPARTLKLYGLRGEEGARFGRPYIGSSAIAGRLSAADLALTDPITGQSLASCMHAVGADIDRIATGEPLINKGAMGAWVELHIEQGPVLIDRQHSVGIVTGIRGNIRHRSITCVGDSGHSGAVPRNLRHDAVFACAQLITRLNEAWQAAEDIGEDIVVTAGIFQTDREDQGVTKIPHSVNFSLDIRSQSQNTLDAFYQKFTEEYQRISAEYGVRFALDPVVKVKPAIMDSGFVETLLGIAREGKIDAAPLASGAGHDAAVFANFGVPSAMIFVRNQNGSHNPSESMEIEDFVRGVAVMRAMLSKLASS